MQEKNPQVCTESTAPSLDSQPLQRSTDVSGNMLTRGAFRNSRVSVNWLAGDHLVRHVEERKVLLLRDHVCNALPLLWGGVDTSGVVGTCMQQDHGAVRRSLHTSNRCTAAQAAYLQRCTNDSTE